LDSSMTASYNTAVGDWAMFRFGTGLSNVGLGRWALLGASGNGNIAIGSSALSDNAGDYNVIVGFHGCYDCETAAQNTGLGSRVLNSLISGNNNSAVGYEAMYSTTTGYGNVAQGFEALHANTEGYRNTSIGTNSMLSNTTGYNNTGLGYSANSTGSTYFNTTGLGHNADCTASHQVRIGNANVISIGGYANWTNISDGRFKENIAEDVPGLDFIGHLRPVTYTVNVDGIHDFFVQQYGECTDSIINPDKARLRVSGFIAQEVEATARKIGYEFSGVDAPKNDQDFYGLRYAEFVVPLVKAVQELAQTNAALRYQIEQQEEMIMTLRAEQERQAEAIRRVHIEPGS
ncbi:MAG: tail fiber domain-containing protein, partial [Saprospiraceae bacterium]|nr:tail fiber domain-containing protein [Saprospiraceae bacterium]